MKRIKAFNIVELMMVMVVLGIIITLTMPLLRNLVQNEDIHRSYMKKANQDVTDAFEMGFLRNPTTRDMAGVANATALRNIFNSAINGIACTGANGDPAQCTSETLTGVFAFNDVNGQNVVAGQPYVVTGGKEVMAFVIQNPPQNGINGFIYIDMNGHKQPNRMCQDRYRFIIQHDNTTGRDTISMDTDTTNNNPFACTFELQ